MLIRRTLSALPFPAKSGSASFSPHAQYANSSHFKAQQYPSSYSPSLPTSEPSTVSSLSQSYGCFDTDERNGSDHSPCNTWSFSGGPATSAVTHSNNEPPDVTFFSPTNFSNRPILRFFATSSKAERKRKKLRESNATGKRAEAIRTESTNGKLLPSTKLGFSSKFSKRSKVHVLKKSISSDEPFTVRPKNIFDIGRQPPNGLENPDRHALTEDNVRLHAVMSHSAVTNRATLMKTYLCEQSLLLSTLCTMDPESDLARSVARTNYLLNLRPQSSDSYPTFRISPLISPVMSDDSDDTELEYPTMYALMGKNAFLGTSEFSRSIIWTLYGPKSRLSQLERDSSHKPASLHSFSSSHYIRPETLDSLAVLYLPIFDYVHCTKRNDPETATTCLEDEEEIELLASPPRSIEGDQETVPQALSGTTRYNSESPEPSNPQNVDVQTSSDFLEPSATTPPCNTHPQVVAKRRHPSKQLWSRFCTFFLHHTPQPEPPYCSSPIPPSSVSLGNVFRETKHLHFAKDDIFPFSETGPDYSRRDLYYHQNASIHRKRNMF